jgi:hypothetical protein
MTENYNDAKRWKKVPLAEVQRFAPGKRCVAPSWWAVTDDDHVLYFKGCSPQRNTVKAIVERIRPDCRAVFIEHAFDSGKGEA